MIVFPESPLVGAFLGSEITRDRFQRLVRLGFPHHQRSGRLALATSRPLGPIAPDRNLLFCIGPLKLAGKFERAGTNPQQFARHADRAVLVHLQPQQHAVWLFRDWTGASPLYLFQTEGVISFATRIGPLLRLGASHRDIRPLPPGHAASVSAAGIVVRAVQPLSSPSQNGPVTPIVTRIRTLVEAAIERFSGDTAFVLLSGGVDSTILAYLLKRRFLRVEGVVMSRTGYDREAKRSLSDLSMAREVAKWLAIPLHEVLVTPRQFQRAVPTVVAISETRRASVIDELAGMYYVARYLRNLGLSELYTGEGPDDIFGGLAFELRFTPAWRLHTRMRENLARELPFELSAHQQLHSTVSGTTLWHPYLYRPLVRFALGIPPRLLLERRRLMKVLFRTAFQGDIPDEFLWRPKAITRVATGLKPVAEARFSRKSTRYYSIYRRWLYRHSPAPAHPSQ